MSNERSYIAETLAPADTAAVAEAVRNAGEKGMAVYPVGGGTMLDFGATPTRPGVAVSLANVNRVIDYPVADMTITVEAGITVAELNRQLAAQNQRLPVDVPHADRATLGGAIACGVSGPRRHAFGTLRDYLLGFTAVDGTGTVFSGGGRVVKNAAGYNMPRLMVGSLGTLGVVTQVTLMVRPRCEASVFLVCEVPDFAIAERLLADLVLSSTRPTAVEFVAGRQPVNDVVLGPMLDGNVGRLYVGFEGEATEVDWMAEQLRGRWVAAGANAPMLVPTTRTESLWQWFTEFAADLQINVLPSHVVETVRQVLAIAPNSVVHAHAGDGVILVSGIGDELAVGAGGSNAANHTPLPSALTLTLSQRERGPETHQSPSTTSHSPLATSHSASVLRDLAAASGGKLIVRRPIGGAAMTVDEVWGKPGPEVRIMQAMKERFDPKNILNPGRFIFA